MRTKIEGVRRAAYAMPWFIQEPKLAAVLDLVDARANGESGEDFVAEHRGYEPQRTGSVAVLPLIGVMARRVNMVGRMSGGTSTEEYGQWFDEAIADPAVSAIVLLIDSPGGSCYGTPELARKVFAARGKKRIIAVADSLAASAGFYVFAAADERVITPSGEVGSLGVYMAHDDYSGMLAMEGVKRTYIFAGQYKVEGNPYQPLGDDAKAYMQAQVQDLYNMFVDDVARFCGVGPAEVEGSFGQGRTLLAARAVAAGMAHRVASLDEVMAELTADDEQPLEDQAEVPPLVGAEPGDGSARRSLPERAESRELTGEASAEGGIEGLAVPYGRLSLDLGGFREEFAAGAFTDSVAGDDVRVLWQHDVRYVFGRTKAGTARVWEEGNAVRYSAEPPDAQWARDAVASIRRGDVDQNSFTFKVLAGGERWERRDGQVVRVITRAKLFEVGPQTMPAYTDTTVAARSMAAFLQAEGAGNQVADGLARRRLQLRRAQIG